MRCRTELQYPCSTQAEASDAARQGERQRLQTLIYELGIAEVNQQAPWTFGERYLYEKDLDCILDTSQPPLESPVNRPGATELAIAGIVAGLIEDGSTLQFGLGVIPETILSVLGNHRDLGVHSGTIGDGVADLMERV
ncbi:MAG: hypothetical protein ACOH2R_04660 [Pseudomonas sp.]